MKLFTYFRSSASYRVRIALNLKAIDHETAFVHLRKREQDHPDYVWLNPQRLVPTLVDGPHVLTQSLAMLEYLDETHPQPPLLPAEPAARARVRSLAYLVASDIHPLNNLRVLQFLSVEFGVTEEERTDWYRHWVALGFGALERLLTAEAGTGRYCHGDQPTLADACLVPQIHNAERFGCPMDAYPTIRRINTECLAQPAFADAAPNAQSDADA